jgi:hypothetical protein
MKTVDFGATIVLYNLVIGVLLVLASSRIAAYAGKLGQTSERVAKVSISTFGWTVAVISASIYVFAHLLRIGVD